MPEWLQLSAVDLSDCDHRSCSHLDKGKNRLLSLDDETERTDHSRLTESMCEGRLSPQSFNPFTRSLNKDIEFVLGVESARSLNKDIEFILDGYDEDLQDQFMKMELVATLRNSDKFGAYLKLVNSEDDENSQF